MSDAIVAYRYAKALIELAIEQNVVDDVNDDMGTFVQVCDENKEFMPIMANPIIRHGKKKSILRELFESRVHKVTFSIINVLTNKNRESLLYAIAKEFQKLYVKLKNIQLATVVTVEPITESQRSAFVKLIKDAGGKEVDLKEEINEELIGGYILKVGDTQIDTSVKKKINKIKLELAS